MAGKFVKEVVIVTVKQNPARSQVYDLRNFMRKRTNPENLSMEVDSHEILVENVEVKQVNVWVDKYKHGLSFQGHGSYRFDADVTIRKIDLEQRRGDCRAQRDALEQELESERQHEAELGDKWGNLRRDYEQDNDILRKGIRRHKARIRKLEAEYDQTVMAEKEKRRRQILRWRQTALWKVAWQRLLALVRPD